jgi:hypothetical protein
MLVLFDALLSVFEGRKVRKKKEKWSGAFPREYQP